MSTQLTTAFRNSCKGRIPLISVYVLSSDVQFLGLVAMGRWYVSRCPGVRLRLCARLGACGSAGVLACLRRCLCAGEREWISMRSLAPQDGQRVRAKSQQYCSSLLPAWRGQLLDAGIVYGGWEYGPQLRECKYSAVRLFRVEKQFTFDDCSLSAPIALAYIPLVSTHHPIGNFLPEHTFRGCYDKSCDNIFALFAYSVFHYRYEITLQILVRTGLR